MRFLCRKGQRLGKKKSIQPEITFSPVSYYQVNDMKKVLIVLALMAMLLLAGCGRYGRGETVGYIFAIDEDLFWNHVMYKSTLESSSEDCYLVHDGDLAIKLREYALSSTKVKLTYDRHLLVLGLCPEGTGTGDEIIAVETVN